MEPPRLFIVSNSFLLLVAMPFAPSSFLLLVVKPGARSSVLAPIDCCEDSHLLVELVDNPLVGMPEWLAFGQSTC